MLDRLLGLETEYAIRFSPAPGHARPTNGLIYDTYVSVIATMVPTRPGMVRVRGVFLANGGALQYECLPYAGDDGLVEGGTPECRGPSELVLYQRAQDELLACATPAVAQELARIGYPGELALLKNCRDVAGHTYGAQENYDVEIARGGWLVAWRAGLVALIPLVIASTLVTWGILAVLVPIILVLAIVIGLLGLIPRVQQVFERVKNHRVKRVLEHALYWVDRVVWEVPIAGFLLLYRACAFRAVRRGLLPFVISRPILTGAGTLVDDRFALSEKGVATRRLCRRSLGQACAIFEPGNLCKQLQSLCSLDFRRFGRLFRRRQRLQLGLSDSNMAQTAEYLKVATTCLVIDMAEAGRLRPPAIRRPLRVLRRIVDGDHQAALAIQREYVEHARAFVRDAPVTPLEVTEVIARWSAMLDAIDAIERDPAVLIGQLDWVTKRALIDRAGTTPDARKKIDLKYHELHTGYFARLEARELAPILVTADEAVAARETPPSTTPARDRARLIRELADVAKVKVGWNRVRIGGPIRGRVIRIDDHR